MPEIRFNSALTSPIQARPTQKTLSKVQENANSFTDILNSAIEDSDSVRFSKHAQTRLDSRNIELDANDLKKLSGAVSDASQKGVQDSLILMNGLAFIVNIPDRTVVTAMPIDEASSNVFTNIDGAVIA